MKVTCGELISVGTGQLCCSLDRFYQLLNYLTGDTIFTHQIPRAFRACEPWVRSQYPWLRTVDTSLCNGQNWQQFVASIAAEHGNEFELAPLPAGRWKSVCPVQEAEELMKDRANVVVIQH